MKIMKNKEDEIKVISHELAIKKWEKEFEDNLRQNNQKDIELFPVDELWFENYKNSVISYDIPMSKRIEKYYSFDPLNNSNILHDMKSINPNSDFIFLNKEIMDGFYPLLLKNKQFNIKLIGKFLNGKMITRIGTNLYYCFFIESNLLREGILMFGNIEISSIITDFLNLTINIFINRYFNNGHFSNDKFIIYHRNEFDFLIKKKKNDIINKENNLKIIKIPRDNGMVKNLIKNDDIEKPKRNFKVFSLDHENNIAKNDNFKQKQQIEKIQKNGLNYIEPKNISNIVNCIREYYYSEQLINNFINDNIKSHYKTFKIINKNWLETFKKKFLYNQIKNILSENQKYTDYKRIISDFVYNNNLIDTKIEFIPSTKKENIIKNGKKYFYYNDYQLLSKKSFSEFSKTFNSQEVNKEYNSFLLDNNHIFVQYDESSGEIICYNELEIEHKYFIISNFHLKDIIFVLQKKGIKNGLSYYGCKISNEYNKELNLLDKRNNKYQNIGILKILNNSIHNIDNDEEEKNSDEKVFENLKTKETKKNNEENNIYIPKIIKKRKYLKENMKNRETEEEKEEEFSKTFTNLKNKKSQKSKVKKDNYDDENDKDFSSNKNLNESITNLRNSKIDTNFTIESKENLVQPQKSISKKIEFKPSSTKSKENNSMHRSNKIININSFKQKDKTEPNQTFKSKVKVKTKKDHMETPPQIFKVKNKYSPQKKDNKNHKSFYSPQKTTNYKQKNFEKKFELDRDNNRNNKPFFSPQITKKHLMKPKPDSSEKDEEEEDLEELKNPPGLVGLQNIGATCYMNATLQCFKNVQRFRKGILNLKKGKFKEEPLSNSLKEVFENLWQNNNAKYYAPYQFKELISEMNPLFKGVAANDSKDLILFILETIHNELNRKKHLIPIQNQVNNLDFMSVFKGFMEEYKSGNESIVSEEFYGYFVSIMKCEYCKITTYNVQIMNILFFPLEKVRLFTKTPYNFVTIEDCFKHYEEPELYSGSDQIYCSYCKTTTNAYNQNKLIIGSKTLILNLNRGKGLQYKVGIKFGEYLDLKQYLLMPENNPCYYELIGVLSHFGESNMGGHFIAYCKNSYNCKWYKFNDAMVNESSFQEASNIGLPYVLFYSFVSS